MKVFKILFLVLLLWIGFIDLSYSQPNHHGDTDLMNHTTNTITIWIMYDKNAKEGMERAIEAFKETTDNDINIRCRILAWEEAKNIFRNSGTFNKEIQRTGGIFPDIIQVPSTWALHFAAEGILYDLTNEEWIDREFYDSHMWQTSTCQMNDNIYAMPWFLDVRALYYRKDVFRKIGLDEQGSDLKTWDSFIKVCNRIKRDKCKADERIIPETGKQVFLIDEKGGKRISPLAISGFVNMGWNIIHNIIAPHYWGRTNEEIPSLKNENWRENLLETLKPDIKFCHKVANYVPSSDFNRTEIEIQDDFVKGLYAMSFSGTYLISNLKEYYGSNWAKYFGVVHIPTPTTKNGSKLWTSTFCGGSYLGIVNTPCPNPRALEFVKFLSTNENAQILYTSFISQLPALILSQDATANLRRDNPYLPIFLNRKTWKIYPADSAWFKFEEEFKSVIKKEIKPSVQDLVNLIRSFICKFINWISSIIFLAIIAIFQEKIKRSILAFLETLKRLGTRKKEVNNE
ncbi:MAG: extracellular solute-binding protein [Candidatus Desantisbacteria bacterium]